MPLNNRCSVCHNAMWYTYPMHKHHSLLSIIVLSYVLSLSAWFALRLLFFDTLWWLALLNTAALALFLPLPLLLLPALWRRHWPLVSSLTIPALIFANLYGPLFVPSFPPRAPSPSTSITVMTFNVLWNNRDSAALQQAITSAQADILGVQEVTPKRAEWLAYTFAATYPYTAFRVDGPYAGVGILSRYPITQVTRFALPPRDLALRVVLDVAGTPLHVLVVHFSANRAFTTPLPRLAEVTSQHYTRQADEVQRVIAELQSVRSPHLVLCDCNLSETSQAYAELANTLHDSFREAGWGLGLTLRAKGVPFAVERIDYIWHSPDIAATYAYVGPDGGSDHGSVIARLRIPQDR